MSENFNVDAFYRDLGELMNKHNIRSMVGIAVEQKWHVVNICDGSDLELKKVMDMVQDELGAFVEDIAGLDGKQEITGSVWIDERKN